MRHEDHQKKVSPSPAREVSQPANDLSSAIIPRSVRLERIHPNRERSIDEGIANLARDPFDRIGLASERVVHSVLSSHVKMDSRRLLTWSTREQTRNTIELDGVARSAVFLEYKITFAPERASSQCRHQLLKARNIYLADRPTSACRGVGVVVDCGSLVGLQPTAQLSTLQSVVESIRNGIEGYSVKVVSFEEIADHFRRSRYGALLSADSLRAAYERRMRSDRS